MYGPKQTPNRRCGFCGEGVVCGHGCCNVCQECLDCKLGDLVSEAAPSTDKEPDWRKMCVSEIACENPSVADYVKHWEGRTEAAETAEANLAEYALRFYRAFEMYRGAWLREMGGVIRPKHHEIDGFVLRMRDIYEKAKLVDRMKVVMVKKLKEKADASELFDAVFQMLAEDRHDQIPTN